MSHSLVRLPPDDPFDRIAADLEQDGLSIHAGLLPAEWIAALAEGVERDHAAGRLRHAGIGRGPALTLRPDIRGDQVRWLEETPGHAAEAGVRDWIEQLRLAINRRLCLGLFEFEGHYARYPEGSFYRCHLDQHRGSEDRRVTLILYLNRDWQPGDGGELRIHLDGGGWQDVAPAGGTLVCFLSDRFPHEVLPTRRPRLSLTGWYRVRGRDGLPWVGA